MNKKEPSRVVSGYFRVKDKSKEEIQNMFSAAIDNGINFFDHADKYGGDHVCESRFGESIKMSDDLREEIYIQTKCGIRSWEGGDYYDFSKEHIIRQAEDSLKALHTEYIDSLLLHRPDTLMEGEEIAEAFETLHSTGKVRNFGVSNFTPYQVEYVQKYVNQKIRFNQIQFSLVHASIIDNGVCMNTVFDGAIDRDRGVLEYSRINDITIQAWSPMQYGWFEGIFLNNDKFTELNKEISLLAEKYNTDPIAISIAWILRHPANMQAVIGTTNPERIKKSAQAMNIELTRKEWYKLYSAAGHFIP
ncbi:MAG: aldo/keto reductase [Clostridia bacterium]|nr:aldo/keto reductase [Clostridia bacterium]